MEGQRKGVTRGRREDDGEHVGEGMSARGKKRKKRGMRE